MALIRRRRSKKLLYLVILVAIAGGLYWLYHQEASEMLSYVDGADPVETERKSEKISDQSLRHDSNSATNAEVDQSREISSDADASSVEYESEVEEPPRPTSPTPPDFASINIAFPPPAYRKAFLRLPTGVSKFCQLPYERPRNRYAEHRDAYRLIASYQLIAPGNAAPIVDTDDEQVARLADAALRSMNCSLSNAERDRIIYDFTDFRAYLESIRNDKDYGVFVRMTLREDGVCESGQLTPFGIAHHLQLGETMARELVEQERLLNDPYEDDGNMHGSVNRTATWLREVRNAARAAFRTRVRARTTRTHATAVGALATMFGLTKRLNLPTSYIRITMVDLKDRLCDLIAYADEDPLDCECPTREMYADEVRRERDAQVFVIPPDMDAKQFSDIRKLLDKMGVSASKYDEAARVVLANTCDQVSPICFRTEDSAEESYDLCFKPDEIARLISTQEFLEAAWARQRLTLLHAVTNTYPYLLNLIGLFTREIAGPEKAYKMLDTAWRFGPNRDKLNKQAKIKRNFVALNLDFADVNFLTDVRRALNISSIGTSTRWMGFGQRLNMELYESLQRAPGEVLVRITDIDRELSQKICPKTYGGGLCQLALIHDYVATSLVYQMTGVYKFNRLCQFPE